LSAAFGGGAFSTPGTWLLIDGATLDGTAPTMINYNFVEGLSGVTPSLNIDGANGDISLVLTAGIAGDYNGDNKVDAADYVVWRKNPGNFLPNAYDTWRANFGNPPGSGAGLGTLAAIPEPNAICTLLALSLGLPMCVRRRSSRTIC
jgi:hypothetical protein